MTRDQAQAKVDQKIAGLALDSAVEAYTMLRQAVFAARDRGEKVDRATAQAMVLTGNALEKRIGADAFDALMDEIDGVAA